MPSKTNPIIKLSSPSGGALRPLRGAKIHNHTHKKTDLRKWLSKIW